MKSMGDDMEQFKESVSKGADEMIFVRQGKAAGWTLIALACLPLGLGLSSIFGTWQRTDWFVRLCFGPLELVGGALGGYIGIRLLGYRIPMVIEADGISVERRGKIRWDQIARIETSKVFFLPTGVILFLTDGQEVELGGAAGGGKRFDLLVKERWERHTRR